MKIAVLILITALALSMSLQAADPAAYMKGCKACHGPEGQGNPAIAKMLSVTLPVLSSKAIQAKPDAEIKKIVMEGKGKMKPVKTLSAGEIDAAIAFVRTLAK